MPLLKLHVRKGRSREETALLLDTAHQAMVRSFGVPERDRYQFLAEYDEAHFRILDTGLGIARTGDVVFLEVVSRPRSRDAKLAFYRNLCSDLETRCKIAPSDVIVTFVINTDEDWSFGYGRAQFVAGALQ